MMPKRRSPLDAARKVRLLAMDVDGVLTSGDVVVLESGEEIKFWNAKDRLALALVRDSKIDLHIAWITGRASNAVTRSAADLGIRHVVQKCHDKKTALKKILDELGLTFDQAAFVGDDLLDVPPMVSAGFSACPSDAVPDVRARALYVSKLAGGKGAVRDVLEFILRAQKKWDIVAKPFLS